MPKLIEHDKEFTKMFKKLREDIIYVRDKRVPIGKNVESLIKLGQVELAEESAVQSGVCALLKTSIAIAISVMLFY